MRAETCGSGYPFTQRRIPQERKPQNCIVFNSLCIFVKMAAYATGLYSECVKSNLWGQLPCRALIRLCRTVMGWFLETVPSGSLSNQVHVHPVVETSEPLHIAFPSMQATRSNLTPNLLKPEAGLIILSGNTALRYKEQWW